MGQHPTLPLPRHTKKRVHDSAHSCPDLARNNPTLLSRTCSDTTMEQIGGDNSGYDIVGGELRTRQLLHALAHVRHKVIDRLRSAGRPSLSFTSSMSSLAKADPPLTLPEGSRIMETGGFKGQSREMPRGELYEALESCLGYSPSPNSQPVRNDGIGKSILRFGIASPRPTTKETGAALEPSTHFGSLKPVKRPPRRGTWNHRHSRSDQHIQYRSRADGRSRKER